MTRFGLWSSQNLQQKCWDLTVMIQLMNIIQQIIDFITRPPRQEYNPQRLGPNSFDVPSQTSQRLLCYKRDDFVLVNSKQHKLQVSFYSHQFGNSRCILYLHANNGSRIEALDYLYPCLAQEYSFCCFDFSGSGISQGETVTLGYNQSQDIATVVDHLVSSRKITEITLWGRSMGAVSALMYSVNPHNTIKGLILDSPYKDLGKLIKQTASERTGLPKILFHPLLFFIDWSLQQKINLDLQKFKVKKYLESQSFIYIPSVFVVSKQDRLVGCHHGQKLFSRYRCTNKQLKYIQSDHNQHRSALTTKELLATIDAWRIDRESQLSISLLRRIKSVEQKDFAKMYLKQSNAGQKNQNSPFKVSLAELKGKDFRAKGIQGYPK